jgi:hypothetical protein
LIALGVGFADSPAPAATAGQQDPLAPADETATAPTDDAMRVMNWVAATGDNNDAPYMVIDKVAAEVFVFDPDSQLVAASPALVGMKVGDESAPGVGDRELSNIPPDDRTTPAGRFVAKFGRAAGHRDVLWVDYPTAISLHAVIRVRKQQRLERLESPTPEDNRITYGCINVPADFYSKVVKPLFSGTRGVVYVLPETRPLNDVFQAMPPPANAISL